MRFSLIGLWLIALPLFAAEPVDFTNDREGTSFYDSSSDKRAIARALKQVDESQIRGAFDDVERSLEENKLCSYDLNASLNKKLKEINPKFSETEGAILYLRTQNEFDDSVAKMLMQANTVETTNLRLPKNQEELFLPSDKKVVESAVATIANFEKKNTKGSCFDDSYRSLYGDVLKADKSMKSYHFEALLVEAYQQKKIDINVYMKLERARVNELETSSYSLKSHYKKIKSLRNQFPLRDPEEKSNFVTGKVDKLKVSHRQKLLEGYSDIQIMLMANVIKKLRTRLDSPKAEILIYDRQNGVETIELDPMERFRLAIKLLRKEMSLIALNTYFQGRTPDYLDLMTAAYEVGIIPASELEEVAGLQDIWNPKKTFWEKAQVWIRTLSSVATIAIPPPYGFIPALALVVIEMTAGKKNDKTDDPTVLF